MKLLHLHPLIEPSNTEFDFDYFVFNMDFPNPGVNLFVALRGGVSFTEKALTLEVKGSHPWGGRLSPLGWKALTLGVEGSRRWGENWTRVDRRKLHPSKKAIFEARTVVARIS